MIAIFLMLSFLATEVNCREDFPDRCTAGLHAGDAAPFAGVLMSGDLAAHLYLVEKNEAQRIDLAVGRATELKDVEIRHQKTLREIDRDTFEKKLAAQAEHHKKELELVTPHWTERPPFVAIMSVGGTIVAIAAAVAVVLGVKEVIEATSP